MPISSTYYYNYHQSAATIVVTHHYPASSNYIFILATTLPVCTGTGRKIHACARVCSGGLTSNRRLVNVIDRQEDGDKIIPVGYSHSLAIWRGFSGMWQIVVSGINKVRSDRMINGRDRRYFRREDRQIARKKTESRRD